MKLGSNLSIRKKNLTPNKFLPKASDIMIKWGGDRYTAPRLVMTEGGPFTVTTVFLSAWRSGGHQIMLVMEWRSLEWTSSWYGEKFLLGEASEWNEINRVLELLALLLLHSIRLGLLPLLAFPRTKIANRWSTEGKTSQYFCLRSKENLEGFINVLCSSCNMYELVENFQPAVSLLISWFSLV